MYHNLRLFRILIPGFAFDGAEFSNNISDSLPIVITPGNFSESGEISFTERNTKRFIGDPPAAFRFNVGDLVVVMTDLSSKMKILGIPAFIDRVNVLHNQRIGRVIFLTNEIDKRFVYYFMMSDRFLSSIKRTATGTMVKHTAPRRILENALSFPIDKKAQQAVVKKLSALREDVHKLTSIYKRKSMVLEDLKKSFLHQAFTGAL